MRSFWQHYDALPANVRELADANFALLRANAGHPSLNFKPVAAFWSARVGLHYRVLARRRGDDVYWFWIGPHGVYDRLIK